MVIRRLLVLLGAVTGLLAAGLFASGPVGANPASVTIAGSLQSELGCPGDWMPDCDVTDLTLDGDDDVWQGTFSVPAGDWEYKAPLNDSWDENYGLGALRDGPNIPLSLAAPTDVKFYYDDGTHWITDDVNSVIATVPGDFQSELGCGSDWDPGCLRSWLQDPDGDGVGRFSSSLLPPGDYQAKVAIDEAWDENYGAGGVADGPNIPFTVESFGDVVTFSYDQTSHVLTIDVAPVTPVDDAALVREPVRHPFADEILYFAMPDRFNDGRQANNCGEFDGPCVADDTEENVLTHGYLPGNKGYYHGGDVEGLRRQLPYLQNLGVSTIWVGPIFKNKTVQPDSTSLYGRSASYHGYWILDFLQVDPHLGTNQEFARLVDDAHERGIKVFMDVVTNHTADVIQLEGNAGYRNKTDFPYLDAGDQPFDDSGFAYSGQPDYTFPAVDASSFPYVPVVPPGEESAKNPSWLNDPLLYHNRGDSSFVSENSLYGDFFGLDDLWTERREVVEGMIDIFSFWIEEFEVDGFRIDTTKHVNVEFWQKFGPDILAAARAQGIDDFFAFGEVFDQQFGPPFLSYFSTTGELQSTIDFAFQMAARDFASRSQPTDALRSFFEGDDYYTDIDSNAYAMPTFLGNHDMGRIGHFLQRQDQVGAGDEELVARSQLGHALMYFSRGQPVIYYGDEQGFTGDGGDKDAREDMFANTVPVYEDNDLLGTDATTSDDNFDRHHPIYQYLRELGKLYDKHDALRTGAQIHRYSTDGPGVYAFSRVDRDERIEYVVALNNGESVATAGVPTFSPGGVKYQLVSDKLIPKGSAAEMLTTAADGSLEVTVPPLGVVIYQAKRPVPVSQAAPGIEITSLDHGQTVPLGTNSWDGHRVRDRIEVAAELDTDQMAEVTFAVRVGSGDYEPIGTDDNPPYRVFYDASSLEGTDRGPLSFRAIVNDLSGNLAAAEVVNVTVEFPEPTGPETPYAVVHYQRPAGDYGDHTTGDFNDFWGLHLWGDAIVPSEGTVWQSPKPFLGEDDYGRFAWVELADDSLPVNFIVHQGDTKDPDNSPDRSFVPGATPEIWLKQGDGTIYTSRAEAQGFASVHYACSDCAGVSLDAVTDGGSLVTDAPPDATNDYGAVWNLTPADLSAPVTVSVSVDGTPDVVDQVFTPTDIPAAWLQPGEQVLYSSRGGAEDVATIHYHRPAGDYGDPTSSDFNDFWGLHTWTGSASPTDWPNPVRPDGFDIFGAEFRVDLVDGADQLAYIIHRGDTKDPGPDQFLVFDRWGHEVWQVEGADVEHSYVAPPKR
ncbi:MAG: alpha-amylase family glycosyl hydrolase [Acidimicrobiia bacterium]|nr:alpha-amylase family glycosyl hydrolase [Acidimicrobiia bacterium]